MLDRAEPCRHTRHTFTNRKMDSTAKRVQLRFFTYHLHDAAAAVRRAQPELEAAAKLAIYPAEAEYAFITGTYHANAAREIYEANTNSEKALEEITGHVETGNETRNQVFASELAKVLEDLTTLGEKLRQLT